MAPSQPIAEGEQTRQDPGVPGLHGNPSVMLLLEQTRTGSIQGFVGVLCDDAADNSDRCGSRSVGVLRKGTCLLEFPATYHIWGFTG
jgi:hypothetical protein